MNYTFADAIAQLENGKAAKRPGWRGYVKRVDGQSGAYDLVYVKPDGTSYTYHHAADGTVTAPQTAVTLDAELHVAMLSNDWIIADTTSFEQCRQGSGTW